MENLEEEALNLLHKEADNDKITMSDLFIISQYHRVLIKLIEKRIDSIVTIENPLKIPDDIDQKEFGIFVGGFQHGIQKVKEMLK